MSTDDTKVGQTLVSTGVESSEQQVDEGEQSRSPNFTVLTLTSGLQETGNLNGQLGHM